MSMDESEFEEFSHDTSQSDGVCSESLDNDDSGGTFSEAVDSMQEGSPSHSSPLADNVSSDGPLLDRSVLGWEMVDGKFAIAFFPDFIVYRDLKWNCTDSKVIFSSNGVRACESTAHGEGERSINLAIEDILDIRSQRCGRLEIVEVKIKGISRDKQQAENVNGTLCVEEMSFCIVDSLWRDKIEEITSLNVKYKTLCNFMLDTDVEMDMEVMLSQKTVPVPKKFFPKFVENFDEVIYPEGDRDAVSISMRDLDMLKPDTFVNDTIIDFYIKYLKDTLILPEERPRFHFFNCFFFRKLADMDKDPSSAFQGRAAFLRVRKWTKKIDLFSKDFIFIPVNYSYHWSLIVICHPGEIVKSTDEEAENLTKVPCILHMDSLIGSHGNLKDLMQSYLWEEWKERQRETDEAIASKFLNLRFVPLELPQQPNLFDCGLFLLHYIESFLEARLANFSPFMVKKSSYFLTSKWFLPDEPYRLRTKIIRMIHGLVNKCHISDSNNLHYPSNIPQSNNDKENDLEVIGAGPSPSKDESNEHMPLSNGGLGLEMDLLHHSSFESREAVISESGLVLRELFDPMSSSTEILDVKHQALGRTSPFRGCRSGMPSIEEEVEADLQLVQTSTEPGSQHIVTNNQEASAFQFQSDSYSNQRFFVEGHENTCSFPANPSSNYSDLIVAEKCPVRVFGLDDHMDHPNHESAGDTMSFRNSELASLDDHHMDHPNHESAGNTMSFRNSGMASLDDHMDHPNHESAGDTMSFRNSELASLKDHMDHPNHESAGDTMSFRNSELASLEDHMGDPNHESASDTMSFRKAELAISLDDHMDHPNQELASDTMSFRNSELASLNDHMDHPNHESAGNTMCFRNSELANLDDHMDHPNHESAGDTISFRESELASYVDHPNHESADNTKSFRNSELAISLDDDMDHPNHESADDTKSCRKRDFASGVTESISCSRCLRMNDHHDTADHPISFLDNLPELSLENNGTRVQEGASIIDDQLVLESQQHPAAKKMRLMLSLEMNNPTASLSEDLHL